MTSFACIVRDIFPLHLPDESGPLAAAAWRSDDARIEHLRRVPLFNDCTQDEPRGSPGSREASRSQPTRCVVTEMGTPGSRSLSSSMVVDRAHFWRLLNETPELVWRILTVLSRLVRRLEQAGHAMFHRMNVT
jgi:hypothetical protein